MDITQIIHSGLCIRQHTKNPLRTTTTLFKPPDLGEGGGGRNAKGFPWINFNRYDFGTRLLLIKL